MTSYILQSLGPTNLENIQRDVRFRTALGTQPPLAVSKELLSHFSRGAAAAEEQDEREDVDVESEKGAGSGVRAALQRW